MTVMTMSNSSSTSSIHTSNNQTIQTDKIQLPIQNDNTNNLQEINENDDGDFQPFISKKKKKVIVQEQEQQQQQRSDGTNNSMNRSGGGGGFHKNKKNGFTKGWSKPKVQQQEQQGPSSSQVTSAATSKLIPMTSTSSTKISEKQTVQESMANMVPKDIETTTTTTVDAFDEITTNITQPIRENMNKDVKDRHPDNNDNNPSIVDSVQSINDDHEHDFFSRMKNKTMIDLLNEFGEQDMEWKKIKQQQQPEHDQDQNQNQEGISIETNQNDIPLDDDHDIDENDPIDDETTFENLNDETTTATTSLINNNGLNRLLRAGLAPIHIEFVSFGYRCGGVPSGGGSTGTYSQPLPPYDCRHLVQVPTYLQWMDGLSSVVKAFLLKASLHDAHHHTDRLQQEQQKNRRSNHTVRSHSNSSSSNNNNTVQQKDQEQVQHIYSLKYYAQNIVAEQVSDRIQESIHVGGHGYAYPLRMRIYIGSEYGQHRSVVLCECAAVALRKLLRTNVNNIYEQPCSVGCYHRELQNNNNNKNNEKNKSKKNHDHVIKKSSVTTTKKKGIRDVFDERV